MRTDPRDDARGVIGRPRRTPAGVRSGDRQRGARRGLRRGRGAEGAKRGGSVRWRELARLGEADGERGRQQGRERVSVSEQGRVVVAVAPEHGIRVAGAGRQPLALDPLALRAAAGPGGHPAGADVLALGHRPLERRQERAEAQGGQPDHQPQQREESRAPALRSDPARGHGLGPYTSGRRGSSGSPDATRWVDRYGQGSSDPWVRQVRRLRATTSSTPATHAAAPPSVDDPTAHEPPDAAEAGRTGALQKNSMLASCSSQVAPSGHPASPPGMQGSVHVPPSHSPATQSESTLHRPPNAPGVGTG